MTPDKQTRSDLHQRIPPSSSDLLLQSWGYDLIDEYFQIIEQANFCTGAPVLELATGSGRMTAVLSRLGFRVVTGDLNDEKLPNVLDRLNPGFLPTVQMMLLDLEKLPFKNGMAKNVVCVNTLHELEHPRQCLSELVRITSPEGILILGDFNETGFNIMQRLHAEIYHNDHTHGTLRIDDAESRLRREFSDVHMVVTPLNITYIASRRK